jgi:hypothetical protein
VIDPVASAALEQLGHSYAREPAHARQTNCCIFAERILHRVYPSAPWSKRTHADLMIVDPARKWSPMDAVVAAGVGAVVSTPTAGRWHLCQGWRANGTGHTFLWLAETATTGRVLEATNADRTWWRALSWASQCSTFDEVRLAVLKTP